MNIAALVERILQSSEGRGRYMVAIAGPPGAGKSTLSHELVRLLPDGLAIAVPLDGFHYDNSVLDRLNLRKCKGAPETFDFAGFSNMLRRIRDVEPNIAIPIFDREADLARAGAAVVSPSIRFILVEGNYLLLDEKPWSALRDLFDLAIFLDVPRSELQRRLMQRWLDLGDSRPKAENWVATNDMPNVDRVLARQLTSDITLSSAT